MPGISITTTLDADNAIKTTMRVARELTFTVNRISDDELSVQKGSLWASLFLGAFIAYCDFRVTVEERHGANRTLVDIERNTPWWTGVIGVGRTKSWTKSLADALTRSFEDEGGEILDRKDL